MSIHVRRAYDTPGDDGWRVLVDRIWPRGLSREAARLDQWLAEIAPSAELRKWFGHVPEKWPEFRRRYFSELDGKRELVDKLVEKAREGRLTLVFGAKDEKYNNAVALREYLETKRR